MDSDSVNVLVMHACNRVHIVYTFTKLHDRHIPIGIRIRIPKSNINPHSVTVLSNRIRHGAVRHGAVCRRFHAESGAVRCRAALHGAVSGVLVYLVVGVDVGALANEQQ